MYSKRENSLTLIRLTNFQSFLQLLFKFLTFQEKSFPLDSPLNFSRGRSIGFKKPRPILLNKTFFSHVSLTLSMPVAMRQTTVLLVLVLYLLQLLHIPDLAILPTSLALEHYIYLTRSALSCGTLTRNVPLAMLTLIGRKIKSGEEKRQARKRYRFIMYMLVSPHSFFVGEFFGPTVLLDQPVLFGLTVLLDILVLFGQTTE